ncbi:dihydrofolate reductase family protein, partial [Kocuria kalidii]|uniref:RibD family protein n=1 Tax=Kocuria kalidii TaxID=3376283 RepID=UPI0037B44F08
MTDTSAPRGPQAGPPHPDDDVPVTAAPGAAAPGAAEWEALLAGRVPPGRSPGTELVERYGPIVAHRGPLVLAQLGQSLDGFIASRTGHAEFVTGPEDRAHLHRLRALVDAVVVGVGTVVADDCRLTVRAVPGPHPTRVVLDPSARAPRDSAVLTDGAAPTLWVVGEDADVPAAPAPHVAVLRLPVGADGLAPSAVLEALAGRGLQRVLVEGGGRTVSRFLAAGTLHRLYLTTAPMLIGDGVPGIRFPGADHLSEALRAPVRRFVLGGDLCTELT